MASLIICTPGGATDNAYVTLAQANTHFALGLRNDTWLAWDAEDRERAIIQATAEIENQGGTRRYLLSPARENFPAGPYDAGNTNGVANQALHFPRTQDATTISGVVTKQIPPGIKAAVCEQAYWLLERRDAPDLVDRAAMRSQGVTSVSIDGHSESYAATAEVPAGIAPLAWAQLKAFVRRAYGLA